MLYYPCVFNVVIINIIEIGLFLLLLPIVYCLTYLNITAEIIIYEISYNTFDKYCKPLLRSIRIIAYWTAS